MKGRIRMKEKNLTDALSRIQLSDEAQERILQKSKQMICRKEYGIMKSKKKFIVIAAAAVFVLSITAVTASRLMNVTSIESHSTSLSMYSEIPTESQLINDIGYACDTISEFSNGYTYDSSRFSSNALKDGSDTVEEYKGLSLVYSKGEDKIHLDIDKYETYLPESGELYSENDGVQIYASHFINKIIPEDYVKSEEELAAEERGELSFAYDGGNTVEEYSINYVGWRKDGVHYCLMQMNGALTIDELAAMANELIDAN